MKKWPGCLATKKPSIPGHSVGGKSSNQKYGPSSTNHIHLRRPRYHRSMCSTEMWLLTLTNLGVILKFMIESSRSWVFIRCLLFIFFCINYEFITKINIVTIIMSNKIKFKEHKIIKNNKIITITVSTLSYRWW